MENDNNVEKFDPSKLMQGVRDRIKSTFVSLIPDGQWEQMVQKEIDAFFNEKQKTTLSKKKEYQSGSAWNSETYLTMEIEQTPFRSMIWEHCADLTKQVLKEKITKEYFTSNWSDGQPETTEEMKKIIAEAAPMAAARFFQGISFNMMNELKNSINGIR